MLVVRPTFRVHCTPAEQARSRKARRTKGPAANLRSRLLSASLGSFRSPIVICCSLSHPCHTFVTCSRKAFRSVSDALPNLRMAATTAGRRSGALYKSSRPQLSFQHHTRMHRACIRFGRPAWTGAPINSKGRVPVCHCDSGIVTRGTALSQALFTVITVHRQFGCLKTSGRMSTSLDEQCVLTARYSRKIQRIAGNNFFLFAVPPLHLQYLDQLRGRQTAKQMPETVRHQQPDARTR